MHPVRSSCAAAIGALGAIGAIGLGGPALVTALAAAQTAPADLATILADVLAADPSLDSGPLARRSGDPFVIEDPPNDQTHPLGRPTTAGMPLNDIVGAEVAGVTLPPEAFAPGGPLTCDAPGVTCADGSDAAGYAAGTTAVLLRLAGAFASEPPADHSAEYAVLFRDPAGVPWEPFVAFPLDGFTGMTDAFVVSGGESQPWRVSLRHHDPSTGAFGTAPTDIRVVHTPDGVVFLFPDGSLTRFDAFDVYAYTNQGSILPELSAQDTVRVLPDGAPTTFAVSGLPQLAPAPAATTTPATDATDDPRDESPPGDGADPSSGDGGGLPWIPLAGGGVLLLGGGLTWVARRGRAPDAGPGAGAATTVADDTIPAEALAAIGRELGTGTAVDPDVAWQALLGAEHAAQERILGAQRDLLVAWAEGWQRFRLAAVRFAEAYLRAYNGSDRLQQLARDWQVRRGAAQAVDLAMSIITGVRGATKLGAWGWRWLRTAPGAGAPAAAAAAAAATARAQALIDAAPGLQRVAADLATKGRADELLQVAQMADEAGMSADELAATVDDVRELANLRMESLLQRFDVVFMKVASRLLEARGFARATTTEANVVQNLVTMARTMLSTRGTSQAIIRSHEQLDALRAAIDAFRAHAAANPGFLERARRLFTVDGVGDAIEAVGPLCTADDIALIERALLAAERCGNDLRRFDDVLTEIVGPAAAVAAEASATAGAAPGVFGATIAPATAVVQGTTALASDVAAGAGPTAPPVVGAVGSVDAYFMQFGVAGDSAGGFLWDLVTSPIETGTGVWTSLEGISEMDEFLTEHQADLVDLGPALADAIGALRQCVTAANGARLDDPASSLGGAAATELRAVLDELANVYHDAPADWQAAHADELAGRRKHIEQKLAHVTRTADTVRSGAAALPAIAESLDALRHTPDGRTAGALELLNPDITDALTRALALLEGTGAGAFALTPRPIQLSPENEAIVQRSIEQQRRMLAGEETPDADWETPDFSDLPPADD